ncbi:MAG: hypothetical protein AB7U85_02160 [Alphaproteobacteria bacterium]
MLNEKGNNYHKHHEVFMSVVNYISSNESSIGEKKAAVDFLADYVKSNPNEKTGLVVEVINKIGENAPLEVKEYCKVILK